MDENLSSLDGILCHMDDVLIFGSSQGEHDCRLQGIHFSSLKKELTNLSCAL